MRQVFDQGDIVRLSFDPALGHEQRGNRPALVLTPRSVNIHGDHLVVPITQGGRFSRDAGFAVPIGEPSGKIEGMALVNKSRMMDLNVRGAILSEHAPQRVVDEALSRLRGMLEVSA